MKIRHLVIITITCLCLGQWVFANTCEEKFQKILNYQERANSLALASEQHLQSALVAQQRRLSSRSLPRTQSEIESWRNDLSAEKREYYNASEKLKSALKIYTWPSELWWRNHPGNLTDFERDVHDMLETPECSMKVVKYREQNVGYHYATHMLWKEIDERRTYWYEKMEQYKKWSEITELSEVERLAPENVRWCSQMVATEAHPELVRRFCARLDGVGLTRLMPFVGCRSNLEFFGFGNSKSNVFVSYEIGLGQASQYFRVCSDRFYLNEMTKNQSFRDCMRGQAALLQSAPDAAHACADRLNIRTRGQAARSSETLTNINPGNATPPPALTISK